MSGIKDTATVTLNVNGAQAKQMMTDLESKIKDTEATISSLKAKMADPEDIEKAKKQLQTYQKQLAEIKSATEGVNHALGNLDAATPRELEKALRTLNKQLKDMTPGTDVWNEHIEKIKELKVRLAEIREELTPQETLWGKFKNWINDSGAAILALGLGFDQVVSTLRGYVDAYAEMEQEMANVRKFTGMTEAEVASLNEELKKIDTRTSREDLNKLAQEAGRLGKTSQEDVLGFVRAADQINVALDDLGEGATLSLSKLTGIFGDEAVYGTEQSLLKVGSVINELSQNCSASAPYLSQFAERMGGVGAQANMTIPQIMGFAAVLDSNAQAVEASSTALSQVLVRMMQDPAKYANVAGLEVEKFATMLKEDANGALILFLETLQQAGGMDVLSPMFKDMGENGSRAIAALSTLATHIDQVKAQQEAANKAFEEGTSVTVEFNVQNNTVQAGLDKCKNDAHELQIELGERLYPLMGHLLTTGSALMRILLSTIRFVAEHKVAIIAITAAVAAYLLVINKEIIIKKLRNAIDTIHYGYLVLEAKATKALAVVTEGASLIYYKYTGQVGKAMVAQKAFNAAMASTPWGAILAAVAAVIAVLVTFAITSSKAQTESERLAAAQKKITEAEKEAEANCAVELTQLEALYKATQNQTLAMSDRLAAANKLQELYPEIFKNLSQEAILAGDAADAYERLRKNIIRSAQAQARKDLLAETESEILKVERERNRKISAALADVDIADNEKMYYPNNEMGKEMYINSEHHPEYIITRRYIDQVREDANEELAQLRKERELLGSSVAMDAVEEARENAGKGGGGNGGGGGGAGGGAAKDPYAAEKDWRARQEALAGIEYAKGETDYEQYTTRMNEISVEYNQKLLDREDVTGTERLKILADYWEAVNKDTKHWNSLLIMDENDFYERDLTMAKEAYLRKLEAGNLTAEQRVQVDKDYQERVELAELEHLRNLVSFTEEGTAERAQAEKRYLDARLKAAQRHQQEYEKQQAEHEKRLASFKDKYFGLNEQERQKAYNDDISALTEVYNAEMLAAGANADERLRIEEAFQQAKLELQKKYGLLAEEDNRNAMERGIASSIEWLEGDGGKALTGTLSTLTSGMSAIFSGLSSLIQAELQIQTAAIEKRYNKEIEFAQGNSYKVAKLEQKKEKDLAKAKNEANKKMFAMQVIQAVAQTATNALNAYGSAAAVPVVGYILAPIAAAMAVAAGAVQIAAIRKQQQASDAQGYSQGGFTKPGAVDEPAGIVHAGEWVASQKLLANPVARPMIEALDYAQRTNTIGSLRAEDVSRSIRANDSLVRMAETDGSEVIVAAAVAQSAQAVAELTQRLNEPFVTINTVTGDHGINAKQEEYARLMDNVTPKSKRKKG